MIREKTYKKFYDNFDKKDVITVNLLISRLRISRPTATIFIKELVAYGVIEPIYTTKMDKCYKIIK